ncbi:MAG: DUF4330 domain-containing protein [Firmicutes bacterium]|nr:DUF4330 domain-containing protein [Bacillota bacterium]
MILNKDGKMFGKINIIDICVILIIVVGIFGFGMRFVSKAAKTARKTTKFEYVIEISDVRNYTVKALEKKGIVSDLKGKSNVGEITDVQSRPMKVQAAAADGRAVVAEEPDKYVATVTIEAEGHESDSGYFVGNDVELSVGTTLSLTTKYANTTGKVKSIKVIK